MNSRYMAALAGFRGLGMAVSMGVPTPYSAPIVDIDNARMQLTMECAGLGVPLKGNESLDRLRWLRDHYAAGRQLLDAPVYPRSFEDMTMQQQTEINDFVNVYNAAGSLVTVDDVMELVNWRRQQTEQSIPNADTLRAMFANLCRAELTNARKYRNQRKRERRARKGK